MINLVNITKSFNGNKIIDDISIKMSKGKVYGFVGRNGSGKTVLLKMITGFIRPDSGYIEINNQRLGKDIDFPANCGVLIENPGFISNKTGYENLKLLADINKTIDYDKIKNMMIDYELDPNDKKKVKQYSLGMKQKLGLIQAFMEEPEIIILDEPMNALDDTYVNKVRDYIKSIKHERLIIITSHNQEDIEILCDEVFCLKNGKLNKIK
ncbi:ABC transporter ATP-binding protein [Thermobrachium celere]|uniref:ABC transporter ATP-binding protein n=1 Tax=Thermobrachium celere TaxID=53422 RepID=UPI0019427E37|nr:ABC transporter ATP-binding protein [Thermobrachium celere]GFR34916.1 multidrug ABC transporter ATP-binding protein [Thermobrachium celere]